MKKIIGVFLLLASISLAINWGFFAVTNQLVDSNINQVDKTSEGNYVFLLQDPFDWGMIRNDDNLSLGKMNSGVLMGKLVEGGECRLHVYGVRNTWFSWSPNLYRVISCSRN